MKKWFLLAIIGIVLALVQTSSAGDLRYGIGFINALTTQLKLNKLNCSPEERAETRVNLWCGASDLNIDLFKSNFEAAAADVAKFTGYNYQIKDDWEQTSRGIFIRADILDGLYFLTIIFTSGGTNYVNFGVDAERDKNDRDISRTPLSPTSQPATIGGTSDVTVLRYLCDQPSSGGYARVFGTIRNSGSRVLSYLKFNVEYFNGSTFVGQESGFVQADSLKPNGETTFEGLASTPAFTRCELSFEDSSGKLTTKLP